MFYKNNCDNVCIYYHNILNLHCDNKTSDNNIKTNIMNSYNLYQEDNYSCVLYHAIAEDEEQVKELAKEAGIDITGLSIDLERKNVKDQLGRPYSAKIEDALIY
jgi:fructose 1,6-bisphosphatase|nr:MAG TPA: hypothetical protein [Caudoviricetes sp.]